MLQPKGKEGRERKKQKFEFSLWLRIREPLCGVRPEEWVCLLRGHAPLPLTSYCRLALWQIPRTRCHFLRCYIAVIELIRPNFPWSNVG